ncbi:MAG: AtpZ/AtpI family protein [Rickettsiales bacterium]
MRDEPEKTPVTLEVLNKHLDEVKKLQPEVNTQAKLPGDAARAAIDFASATAVGTGLGYGADVWLNTSPWGLLIGLLIGTAAGVTLMFQEEARSARCAAKQQQTKND